VKPRPVVVRRGPASPCCYPIGDPRAAGFRFCEAPVTIVGRSYCEEHHALCWVTVRELRAPEVTSAKRAGWGRVTLAGAIAVDSAF
jgi:hypothetical protein